MASTVYVLRGLTRKGRKWIDTNVRTEEWQRTEGGITVEHRYIGDIVKGMQDSGLVANKDFEVLE